ncbi:MULTISPECIES: DUF2770 family protein [Parabacteroides]|nr:DUF2770 family protein [Parabacteroides distasonis]MCC2779583.1 DUF2770 family protein [Parabacteroides distasonis]UEB13380.1 DUF2770 family protein [Parabacteroides distasonis]HJH35114.1 DUF2770 family protein [Parabacteroides distasonis]
MIINTIDKHFILYVLLWNLIAFIRI